MTCEEYRLAAMALADGETPPASRAAIEAHVAACEGCRREIEQLHELARMWQGQTRSNYNVDLWPEIQGRLERPKRRWLPPLVVLLVLFKLADFIVDQIARAGEVSARKMFGEYGLYCDGKMVGVICDDQLFLKPTAGGRAYLGQPREVSPFPQAKPYFLIDGERWDDAAWLCELVRITSAALPLPAPKKKKKSA